MEKSKTGIPQRKEFALVRFNYLYTFLSDPYSTHPTTLADGGGLALGLTDQLTNLAERRYPCPT